MIPVTRRRFVVGGMVGLGLPLAGCLDAARRTTWPMFRGAANNEASTRERPDGPLEVGWERTFADLFDRSSGGVIPSSPIANGESAYLTGYLNPGDSPTSGIGIASLDLQTGASRWRRTLDHTIPDEVELIPPPVLAEDYLVVVGGTDVIVLDSTNGSTVMEFSLPWVTRTVPSGDQYLVAFGNDVIAMADLDEEAGVRWTRPSDGRELTPVNPFTILEDRIYLPVQDHLIAVRRGDGELLWDQPLPTSLPARAAPPLFDGFSIHFRVRQADGTEELIALDRADHSERWRDTIGQSDTTDLPMSAYRAGRVYATIGHTLVSYHVGNGEEAFRVNTDIEAPYPTVGGDSIYLLGDDTLVVRDREDGHHRETIDLPGDPAPRPQEAVPRDEVLLVTRNDALLGLQPGG